MSNKPFILIADDDKNDRFLITYALKQLDKDLNIQEVEDGEALIEFMEKECKENAPSIILLDLNMPKRNGFDVLEYIKGNPSLCPVPVIIFSTSSSSHDISRAKALGATDYMTKPDSFNGYKDIAETLNKFLH